VGGGVAPSSLQLHSAISSVLAIVAAARRKGSGLLASYGNTIIVVTA
jgi:hypothetical protein